MVIDGNITSMNQRETRFVSEYLMEGLLFALISALGKPDTSIIDFAIDLSSRPESEPSATFLAALPTQTYPREPQFLHDAFKFQEFENKD